MVHRVTQSQQGTYEVVIDVVIVVRIALYRYFPFNPRFNNAVLFAFILKNKRTFVCSDKSNRKRLNQQKRTETTPQAFRHSGN